MLFYLEVVLVIWLTTGADFFFCVFVFVKRVCIAQQALRNTFHSSVVPVVIPSFDPCARRYACEVKVRSKSCGQSHALSLSFSLSLFLSLFPLRLSFLVLFLSDDQSQMRVMYKTPLKGPLCNYYYIFFRGRGCGV